MRAVEGVRARWARGRAWFAAHPMAWDAIVLAMLLPFVLLTLTAIGPAPAPAWVFAVMVACWTVPLLWRRTHPEAMAAVVVLGHLVQLVTVHGPLPGNIVVPVVMYALGRYATNRRLGQAFVGVALVAGFVATWDWGRVGSIGPSGIVSLLVNGVFLDLVAVTPWGFGLLARQRALSVQQLRDRAEALERERDQRLRLAAEEERTRIAREMHDVVAHSLSVIVVQADGAAYAVGMGEPSPGRDIATKALGTIAATAREALADTRRLVAVLRGDDAGEAELRPQAGLADLDGLVEPLVAAGRDVRVAVAGDPVPLPRDADLAAYRVVQESLTNVIKHAGPDAAVRIDVAYAPGELALRIADDGRGTLAGDDGAGHGLIGMRERVAAYGGTLTSGPRTGGGFVVSARIPLRDPAGTSGPVLRVEA